ncbi:uncharacterized protein LOC123314139 [Coccinella septempunctata]|uniref:uncharacterized protein LOC123314139 n=1 Tax=Coccinella septempunctata TaxID=41139 RepID=UPI001D065561|nr:uncharacterized protein LOC123314139 [Coccinella septempunctata]
MDKSQRVPRIYECKKIEEPVCQEVPRIEKYDPRSYCHSILAKTEKVCKKTICRKFLKTNELRTKGEIVCIPRPPCKITRHFGPKSDTEDEDDEETFFRMFGSQLGLVLNEGTVSETDILRGRFEGNEKITRDGRTVTTESISGKPGVGGLVTPFGIVQDQATAELLENLSQYLDAEGMAAIAALGGAEICPCCQCTICKCRLRGITSEMLLAQRKKALLEKKLRSWGKQGYVWSFDYFYKPDFEYFEKEREERHQREQKQAEEAKKERRLEEMFAEDKSSDEFFDKTRVGGLEIIEAKKYAEVQATPSIRDEEVEIRSEMMDDTGSAKMREAIPEELEKDLLLDLDMIPTTEEEREKITGFSAALGSLAPSSLLSKSLDEAAMGQYVRSTQRSSIESWVESREPFEGRRPTTVTGASVEPIDIEFPAVEIQDKIRFTKEIETPSIPAKKRKKEEKKGKKGKKAKESELDIREPVLKRKPPESSQLWSEGEEDMLTKIKILPVGSEKPPTGLEEAPDVDETGKVKVSSSKEDLAPTRKYTDVCDCLPGYCVCGAKHFVFKREDVGSETTKPSTGDKQVQVEATVKEEEKLVTEEQDISAESSCVCLHPWDEVDEQQRVTPAASIFEDRVEITKKPFTICIQPIYQKTLIIVKPEAMNYKDVILRAIKKEGLDVIGERLIRLSPEQVAEVYSENYGSAYFPMFVQKMSATPILVLSVAGNYAVDRWKYIIGQGDIIPYSWFYPESMKRRFGLHCDVYGAMRTSPDFFNAKNEIRYFFPLDIIEPIMIKSVEVQDYCDKYIHPTLLKALFKIVEEKPEDPLLFLAEYLLRNNPFQPHYPDSLVAMAPT